MTTVRTVSVTRTTTATYVAAKLVGAMGLILTELGLREQWLRQVKMWELVERSLQVWMAEATLVYARLEVYDHITQAGVVICNFPISYFDPKATEQAFLHDLGMARYLACKARASVSPTAVFRVLVKTKEGATPIGGWGPATALSIAGMTKLSAGTIAGGPHAVASFEMWIRK